MACIENCDDVWDGAVPYIHGTLQSMPSMFSVQAHAFRVLSAKLPQIVDAVEPGGSGDMYAGLTAEERDALAEVTRMGFPPAAWFDAERIRLQYTTVWAGLFDHFATWDPTYFDDFWTVPGYLGANPTESLLAAKVEHKSRIAKLVLPPEARQLGLPIPMALRGLHVDDVPVAYVLEEVPAADLTGAMLRFTTGGAADHHVWISGRRGDYVTTGIGQEEFEHLRNVEGGRRRARRQHAVSCVPDLPPSPGATGPRVPGTRSVPRCRPSRSTHSGPSSSVRASCATTAPAGWTGASQGR